jgi:hypothetical protein
MALLAAVTLDLGHGHAVDADGRQCLAHLVKLERFDDRDDEFHGQAFISLGYSLCVFDGPVRGVSTALPESGIFLGKWHKKLAGLRGKHSGLVMPVTVQG